MAPLRQTRRSRRLSHKSPMEVADYAWPSPQLLQDVQITSPLSSPSPSTCTAASSDSSPAIVTHLPFAPGSSHTRNRKEGHIPRPPNAFMVFRSWLWNKDNFKSIERDNRNVSRIAGRYWNELSEAERAPFRCMAEEAKARHAQLYPEYRYSPTSQKKPRVCQRRSQYATEIENEKCNKVVDLLLGSRDFPKYLSEERNVVKSEEDTSAPTAGDASSVAFGATMRNASKRTAAPRGASSQSRSTKQKTHAPLPVISPPPQYVVPLPTLPVIEDESEITPTQGSFATPELVYPLNEADKFVATSDIPYLSLDENGNVMAKKNEDDNFAMLVPSHLEPAAQSVFSGVKPEATSFVDSCVFGAYTTDVLPAPAPYTTIDTDPYSSLNFVDLVPLGSPVFTNPFDPSTFTPHATNSTFLGTLDQLFGQSVSPLTPIFPTENW